MKYPSWINLLKSDKTRGLIKWWDPKFTDRYFDRIENWSFEWMTPLEWDVEIASYYDDYHGVRWVYTINRDWEVKSLKWKVMKPFFGKWNRWPKVRIKIKKVGKDWKIVKKEKEIFVLNIMEKVFGKYFIGYRQSIINPWEYMLMPKDGNYANMRYDNLHYVKKSEYDFPKKMTKKHFIERGLSRTNEELSRTFGTTQKYVRKVRYESYKEWNADAKFKEYQDLQKLLWIEFDEKSMKLYQTLLESAGKLKNMEIAMIVWPEEMKTADDKSYYTNKVVRARKRMSDKWLIPRFNGDFESKREEAVRMIKDKANSWKTNQEIADNLWLNKSQIDNLSKQIRKEKSDK